MSDIRKRTYVKRETRELKGYKFRDIIGFW